MDLELYEKAREFGSLRLEDEAVIYRYLDSESNSMREVSVPLADIALIGEYTTTADPFSSDWFFVFVRRDGTWHEFSHYAVGAGELWLALNRTMPLGLNTKSLVASAQENSLIIWPHKYFDMPLYTFGKWEYGLSPDVRAVLGLGEADASDGRTE